MKNKQKDKEHPYIFLSKVPKTACTNIVHVKTKKNKFIFPRYCDYQKQRWKIVGWAKETFDLERENPNYIRKSVLGIKIASGPKGGF